MKTIKLITPVGASLFENYFTYPNINPEPPDGEAKDIYDEYKGKERRFSQVEEKLKAWLPQLQRGEDVWDGELGQLETHVCKVWALKQGNQNASAEIASILKIKETKYPDNTLDVYLLATDSIISPLAALIIKQRFQQQSESGIEVYFELGYEHNVIEGLQIDSEDKFKTDGLKNLMTRINQIAEIADNAQQNKTGKRDHLFENMAFNITGGYKAVIPYLSILGQIEGLPLFYIFEDRAEKKPSKLIEIPPLPVDFDFSIIEDHYVAFEQLKQQQSLTQSAFTNLLNAGKKERKKEYNHLQETYRLIQSANGQVQFTFWGDLLFVRYEKLLGSGIQRQSNLRGQLVELKLYEYYANNYLGQDKGAERLIEITPNRRVGESGEKKFEIDLYIETDQCITAVEIKPGGNIPFGVIQDKLKTGGFKYLLQRNKGKKVILEIVLYSSSKDIPESPKQQIHHLHNDKLYEEETQNLKWYWLSLKSNYQRDVNWKVNNRLKPISLNLEES